MLYILLILTLFVPRWFAVEPTVCSPASCDLQAALNAGGVIEFAGTHTAPDRFVVSAPGTRLVGRPGAKLIGGSREAIVVLASDVQLWNFEAVSNGIQSVVRLGSNDSTQTSVNVEPQDISLYGVIIPTHRGKRGFEINARYVLLEDCEVHDTWSSALADSQGIAIYNSSGNIVIRRGVYEAGSENILIGGDTNKMGVTVTGVLIDQVWLNKPLSWRTDGINRVVKNLFELKTGHTVTLQNSVLSGSWSAAQSGHAIVVTPTLDGTIRDLLIYNNQIFDVGNGLQILGRSYAYYTAARTNLIFNSNNLITNSQLLGGAGRLAEISGEPDTIEFSDNTWSITGSSLVTYAWGTVMEADGTKHAGGPMNSFTMTSNTGNVKQYGLNFLGYPNGGPSQQGFAAALNLLGSAVNSNTFSGAATLFKTNFPGNTYQ